MLKELKHFGVIVAIDAIPALVLTLSGIPFKHGVIINATLYPIMHILASMICKYMEWDK